MAAIRAIGFDYLGVVAALPAGDADHLRIDTGVLALVDTLRQAKYQVGLLSNLAPRTPWADDLYDQHVDDHFAAVGLSGELGFAKPDHRAFVWLADRLGVATQELVFIDDRPESLTGVESLGIKPILYKNLRQLQADLHALGVEGDWHS